MPLETLLDNKNSTLTTMHLVRCTLDYDCSEEVVSCDGYEVLVYPLIGEVAVMSDVGGTFLLNGRKSVLQKPKSALRILNNSSQPHDFNVVLTRRTRTADVLLVCLDIGQKPEDESALIAYHPVTDFVCHAVGKGTHRRQVRVIEEQPKDFQIYAGETLNVPGGWSSYPPHANARDLTSFADWQEMFFVITPGHGIMKLDGYYTDGSRDKGVRLIHNGEALATPLGSHPIVFTPENWGWYFWAYTGTAIEKSYNTLATHVTTYVK